MGDVKYFGLWDVSCGFSVQGSLYTTFFKGYERWGKPKATLLLPSEKEATGTDCLFITEENMSN